jgi:polyhydroxyalkanoate synthesis regulator phasin
MNSDNLIQLAQKSLRVTLGATADLLETLQDSQRREESLFRLKTEFDQLADAWEVKGATTEQEARNFVDGLLNQRANQRAATTNPTPPPSATPATPAPATPASAIQQDLQDLTVQLATIRAELERLREQNS